MQLVYKGKIRKSFNKNSVLPYLFIAPNMILFLTFMIIPILYTFYISLTQWSLIGSPEFIGFENYVKLFSDQEFWIAMWNTVCYTFFTVPMSMGLGLIGAMLLNRKIPLRGILRGIFYIPAVVSLVAAGLIWQWIMSTDYGILNYLLNLVGINSKQWLTSNALAMPSVIVATLWIRTGYCMVIYLAGMQSIPKENYEAADIDGANGFQKFTYVTWPLLKSTTVFLLVICIIYGFMAFDLLYIMTGGGPGFATTVMVHYIYQQAFALGEMGYASAGGVVLFLVILSLTLMQLKGDNE
ncbi:MAG: multiple sugar transport system permease protein [Petroclostridium sp.]|jgi:ABC-type sugar transport system permease subunit|nr:transporter permease [Deferribacteraceae bacterium]MDK2811690.1 multiple sugar transport system permease protein [Petroclostridium sp.]